MSIANRALPGQFPLASAVALALLLVGELSAQERIILRDTSVISRKVLSFDEDGVRLDNDRLLGWNEIESGRVADDQIAFDRYVKELGGPLYRLHLRLDDGDYRDALPHAEAVFARYAERRSVTAYQVFQGLMWGRLAHGRRESAIEPYLLCVQALSRTKKVLLPGKRRLVYDPLTGLSPDLDPVWFDAAAARAALPQVRKALAAKSETAPPGVLLYGATLALTAGDEAAAKAYLADLPKTAPALRDLARVVAAQREVVIGKPGAEVEELRRQLNGLHAAARPLAYYWLGRAALASGTARKKEAALLLLHLPALYGDEESKAGRTASYRPELAAAGLHFAVAALDGDNDAGVTFLKDDLLRNYPHTHFARQLQAELDRKVQAERPPGKGGKADPKSKQN